MSAATAPLTRRPETDTDADFLRALYATTRETELALLPWDAAQKEGFLLMQWRAQSAHYRSQFPEAEFSVLELDGDMIGRLVVDRRPSEIHVIDIALLPAARGRGFGTALLQALQAEAVAAKVPLRLQVNSINPARRLYARLGFVPIAEDMLSLTLEWRG